MRSHKKFLILMALLILIFGVGSAYANDLDNATLNQVESPVSQVSLDNNSGMIYGQSSEVTVNNWDELQFYCSQSDKNYVITLKEGVNFYPTNPNDEGYQIQVNNNVTILGSPGSYFGDSSPNARPITYLPIDVPENSGIGITLKGVTFKWISTQYQPNAVFLQMAGNSYNCIEDCYFTNSTLDGGHSSLVHLLRGYASIANCTFTDITSDYGCLSIYDPKDDPTKLCTGAQMDVTDSYFEGNYARTEPGCINNCGVLVVSNSTFYKNTAFWWAGAIHTHAGANTTIYDSNFTDNLAGWNGGALYTYSYLQIYNTIFVGNNCTTDNGGGAIGATKYLHSPYIYIKDSLFMDNENLCWATDSLSEGTGRGGAISFMDYGSLCVLNTTFIENSASVGTAICAISQGSYGSPNVTIIGNRFINHTRSGDVLVINVNYNSLCEISDNYYLNNSIEFSKLKLIANERVGDEVTLNIDVSLKNERYYDSDILDKSSYDVYVDGKYFKTITGREFTLNLKNLEKCQVYVVPSISSSKSNEVSVGLPKEYVYVSQKYGNDNNNGLSRQSPVASIAKACEIARSYGNVLIMDGTFTDSNIIIGYNLTITGEDDVKFTGSSSNTIFTVVNNSEFTISKVTFDSLVFTQKDIGIIRQTDGFTTINQCIFNNNYVSGISGANLIEAKNIEIYNTNFTNHNKDKCHVILVKSNEFLINNCTFSNNIASHAIYSSLISTTGEKTGLKGTITNSIFKSNTVKYGCIYFGASKYPLTITGTQFFANGVASASDHSSCIKLETSPIVKIDSCTFANNVDLGSRSAVIYVTGSSAEIEVTNSIVLNNSYENNNKFVFSASSSANLASYKNLNGNWWGNTQENCTVAPAVTTSACDNWLFLNISTNVTSLSKNQKVLINFDLNNLITKQGDASYYDASNFDWVKFNILTTGGVASDSEMSLVNGVGKTTYTLTSYEGDITAYYAGFKQVFRYVHSRIAPVMFVNVSDIYVGESATVEIQLIDDATGNLTIENVETKPISGSKTTFKLNNLNAGQHTLNILYSGDDHYAYSTQEVKFNVNKYNSTTKISYGEMEVGKDVILNIGLTDGATGNVTLIINDVPETLTVTGSSLSYTIKSISRGNYDVTAIYNGDWKYNPSEDNVEFGVGKIDPTINVIASNIIYGQDALIEVILNANATGNVSVSVDDKNKTVKLENGKANVLISGLNAGMKDINVSYGGDNYYGSKLYSTSFKVSKANTDIAINVNDIKIGASENIEIQVPAGVTGNVTIICGENTVTKAVNVLGKVLWTVSDLSVGQYSVSATLISDNYNAVENTADFEVLDYSTPQWPNQGYDVKNDGKSPYDSDSNGAILWSYNLDGELSGNLAIDSEGNIYVVTTSGIYSINKDGAKRWNYDYVSENISGIAISRDVIIAPIAGNSLYFINQTDGQRYGHSNIYQASSLFAPIVDSNSVIYIVSEYQHASDDYKLVIIPYQLWEYGGNPTLISLGKSQPSSAPVIIDDNYAVVTCTDSIKIIDLNKKEIYSTMSGDTKGVRPVVGSGSIVYVVINNNVQAMTPQGSVIWKTPITGGAGSQLALDEENNLYLINSQGKLYKYDALDGSEVLFSNLNYTSGMLIGNDGIIYIGLNDMLYAFNGAGDILWKSNVGEDIVGVPVMGENGVIYLTTSSSIKAIGKSNLIDGNIVVEVEDISYGETVSVVITTTDDLTGIINVNINSNNYSGIISGDNLIISIPNLDVGQYIANISYSGDARFKPKELSVKFNVIGESQIISSDFTAYCGNQFVVTLKDSKGNGVPNERITVTVGEKKVELITDKNGKASVNMDTAGTYQVTSVFGGNSYLKASSKTSKVVISSTIQASDMKKVYNSGEDFKATFLTSTGAKLSGKMVSFIVGGVVYNATTNSKGVAVLNCKLPAGSYNITVVNPVTGEKVTLKATITKRIVNNKDLTMDYLDGSVYKVRVVGDDGKYVGAGQIVTFKLNGKTTKVKTDKNGYAKLSVTLVPKTYNVTAEYKGDKVSNKVVVKQVLKANDITKKKAKSYKFQATLKTSKGKAISGKKLTFKINGKTYTAKTNKNGVATITIKLNLKVGKYTIKTTYSKTTITNKITIKK